MWLTNKAYRELIEHSLRLEQELKALRTKDVLDKAEIKLKMDELKAVNLELTKKNKQLLITEAANVELRQTLERTEYSYHQVKKELDSLAEVRKIYERTTSKADQLVYGTAEAQQKLFNSQMAEVMGSAPDIIKENEGLKLLLDDALFPSEDQLKTNKIGNHLARVIKTKGAI